MLTNVDTGIAQRAQSSDSGNYRFNSLEPGNYLVEVTASGFEQTTVKVTLETAQTQGVNVELKVGSSKQSITVTSSGPILDVDENRIETTIASEEVVDLPQLNRNTWDTLTIAPGVTGTGTRGAGESPGGGADNFGTQTPALSANGRSYTGNLVMVDGMNVTSPVQNGRQGSMRSTMRTGVSCLNSGEVMAFPQTGENRPTRLPSLSMNWAK